jgi:hypothetical protein
MAKARGEVQGLDRNFKKNRLQKNFFSLYWRLVLFRRSMNLKSLQALFFLCALTCSLFAEPEEELPPLFAEELQTLTNSSDLFVHGLINPLTGCPCLRQRDLEAKGAESLELARTFVSPLVQVDKNPDKEAYLLYSNLANSYRGWVLFPIGG